MAVSLTKRTVCGVGYVGVAKDFEPQYSQKSHPKFYKIWLFMIRKCYSSNFIDKNENNLESSVSADWQNFQNFCAWCIDNYIEGNVLSKNALVKGNNLYSAATCEFITNKLNLLLRNNRPFGDESKYPLGVSKNKNGSFTANIIYDEKHIGLGTFDTPEDAFERYKHNKERIIQEAAWMNRNRLSSRALEAILKYKVEITD